MALTRGVKLGIGAGTLDRSISVAVDMGPRTTSGGTTINGVSLTNLQWRRATQLAVFRLQGADLSYSTTTREWQASTWIVNQARNNSSIILRNRYWRYLPPAGANIQRMIFAGGDPLTARVQLQKLDASDNSALPGVVFGAWTSEAAAQEGTTTVASFVGRATTDSNGFAQWFRLPVGRSYFIRELVPLPGYELNTTVIAVTPIRGNDSEAAQTALPLYDLGVMHNLYLDSEAGRGRVRVIKTDSQTGAGLSGSVFELRAAADIVTTYGKVRLRAGELADTLSSDASGIAESIPLYLGDYVVREVATCPNYLLNPNSFAVSLRCNDQDTGVVWVEVTVPNDPVLVSCEVEKRTIDVTSAAFRSLPQAGTIDNSALGSKEYYRYDIDFRSSSNDWADEFVLIDASDSSRPDLIRLCEIWTPVVWGDFNGRYNIWYQTNLNDKNLRYSDRLAASADPLNPANPERLMRFDTLGWRLWAEDVDSTQRRRLPVADLKLDAGEYLTALKLEFGRVEKGFTSRNTGSWVSDSSDRFYSEEAMAATGLAPLSYLVYCPAPLSPYDSYNGAEVVIASSVTAHITRNIVLADDDDDSVETRLVESFTVNSESNTAPDDESERVSEDPHTAYLRQRQQQLGGGGGLASTGDRSLLLVWTVLAALSIAAICAARVTSKHARSRQAARTG